MSSLPKTQAVTNKMADAAAEAPKLSPAEKKAQKRKDVEQEIYTTERSYVEGLQHLINSYVSPVVGLLSPADFDFCFDSLFKVVEVNEDLLLHLEKAIKTPQACDTEWNTVSKVLSNKTEQLKLYSTFVNNYDGVSAKIKQLKKENPEFAKFMEETEMSSKKEGLNGFSSYMVTPVQRTPRYILLLRELLKHSEPTDAEYAITQKAMKGFEEVAAHINESLRQEEHRKKYNQFMSTVRGMNQQALDLFNYETNNFVLDGDLELVESSILKLVPLGKKNIVHVYLMSSFVLIAKKDKYVTHFLLDETPVPWVNDKVKDAESFAIVTSEKVYNFKAESSIFKVKWVNAFNNTMENIFTMIPQMRNQPKADLKKHRKSVSMNYAEHKKALAFTPEVEEPVAVTTAPQEVQVPVPQETVAGQDEPQQEVPQEIGEDGPEQTGDQQEPVPQDIGEDEPIAPLVENVVHTDDQVLIGKDAKEVKKRHLEEEEDEKKQQEAVRLRDELLAEKKKQQDAQQKSEEEEAVREFEKAKTERLARMRKQEEDDLAEAEAERLREEEEHNKRMKELEDQQKRKAEEEAKREQKRKDWEDMMRKRQEEAEERLRKEEEREQARRKKEREEALDRKRKQLEEEESEQRSAERRKIKKQLDKARSIIKDLRAKIKKATEDKEKAAGAVNKLEQERPIQEDEIRTLQQRASDISEQSRLRTEINQIESENSEIRHKNKIEVETLKQAIAEEEAEIEEGTEELDDKRTQLTKLQSEHGNVVLTKNKIQYELLRAKDSIQHTKQRLLQVHEFTNNAVLENNSNFKSREQVTESTQKEKLSQKRLAQQIEETEAEIDELKDTSKQLVNTIRGLQEQNNEVKRKIVQLSREPIDFVQLDVMKRGLPGLRTQVVTLQAELRHARVSKEELKPLVEDLARKARTQELKEEDMEKNVSHASKRARRFVEEAEKLKKKVADVKPFAEAAEKRFMESKKTVAILKQECDDNWKSLRSVQQEKDKLKARNEELQLVWQQEKAALKQLSSDFEAPVKRGISV